MRPLVAIVAAAMLSVASGLAFAGNKVELTETEMDQVSAAGTFFDVIFLTNPSIRQIGFTSNAGSSELKINGVVTPIVSQPTASNGSFHAVALVTKTTVVGSQPGLPKLGLIQTSKPSFLGFNSPHLVPILPVGPGPVIPH